MSVTQSQLREQYRNTSDEQLLFLAQQGSSKYTETAWAVLREEMTRRGLPLRLLLASGRRLVLLREEIARRGLHPTSVAQGSESPEAFPCEKVSVVLSLGRWGAVPDTGISERFEELSNGDLLALTEQETAIYSRISDELIRPGAPIGSAGFKVARFHQVVDGGRHVLPGEICGRARRVPRRQEHAAPTRPSGDPAGERSPA